LFLSIFEALKKTIKFCGILSALSILLIMILVSADVFFRYVFNSPILGAMEFSLLLMISIIYLGLGYTEICDRHIAINLIYNTLKPKHQVIVTKLNYIILLFIASILFWHSFLDFLKSYEINEVLPGMAGFPKYPSKFCLSFGMLMYIFVIFFKLISSKKSDQ